MSIPATLKIDWGVVFSALAPEAQMVLYVLKVHSMEAVLDLNLVNPGDQWSEAVKVVVSCVKNDLGSPMACLSGIAPLQDLGD